MLSSASQRLNIATLVSIALPAFALEPFVHEFLGHAVTAWLTGAKVILVSSTAMQTEGGSLAVPAAGPLSNLVFGVFAYLILRRIPRFTPARYFIWIFALANLFLGFGYILYSGVINFGDSAYVIAGLHPAWLYRAALILFGAWGYRSTIGLAAQDTAGLLRNGSILASEVPRLIYPACFAGSLLYLVASFLNPVSPSLILYDGVSMAAGIAIGFCLLPRVIKERYQSSATPPSSAASGEPAAPKAAEAAPSTLTPPVLLPFSTAWIAVACVSTVLFLVFLGHGFRPR